MVALLHIYTQTKDDRSDMSWIENKKTNASACKKYLLPSYQRSVLIGQVNLG